MMTQTRRPLHKQSLATSAGVLAHMIGDILVGLLTVFFTCFIIVANIVPWLIGLLVSVVKPPSCSRSH